MAAVLTISGSGLFAQEWSDKQKEVWAFVEEYSAAYESGDYEKFMSAFHDEYKGWSYQANVPVGKDVTGKYVKLGMAAFEPIFTNRIPLSIQVYDEFAVADYTFHHIAKNKETGEVKEEQGRWTDILMKDGKNWYLIADHGGEVDDD